MVGMMGHPYCLWAWNGRGKRWQKLIKNKKVITNPVPCRNNGGGADAISGIWAAEVITYGSGLAFQSILGWQWNDQHRGSDDNQCFPTGKNTPWNKEAGWYMPPPHKLGWKTIQKLNEENGYQNGHMVKIPQKYFPQPIIVPRPGKTKNHFAGLRRCLNRSFSISLPL